MKYCDIIIARIIFNIVIYSIIIKSVKMFLIYILYFRLL